MEHLDIDALKEENLRLRQERLGLYNLIWMAKDQISIFLAEINKKNKKLGKFNEEAKELFKIMINNHTENIEFYLECLQKETALVENGGKNDINLYIIESEQICKQKIRSCEFLLNIIRALRLSTKTLKKSGNR